MKSPSQSREWSRRKFLRGAGLFGMGSAVAALADRKADAVPAKVAVPPVSPQPYDLEKLRKVDPKLIHYELAGTFRAPHDEPQRIVFGPGETLWVTSGKWISSLDAQGELIKEWAAADIVRSLAVAKDGVVYAGLRDHVEVFDGKGKRQAAWNSPAAKAWLTGVAVGEQDAFASDAGNRVVYHYDRSGKLLGRLGEKDATRKIPGFVVPSPYFDLEIGGDNLLWVANPGRSQVEGYTFSGNLETSWGEPSFGIAGFCGCCNPSYFTLMPDGRFVTSEKGLARVKIYSAKGRFECVVAGPEAFPKYSENLNSNSIPVDVAVDGSGRVFVADTLGNEIRIYKRKAQV